MRSPGSSSAVLHRAAIAVAAVAAALAIGAIMMVALGANPFTGYKALFTGAFGSKQDLADTAV